MTTRTRNILLITTSTIAVFGIAYYFISKKREKELEQMYIKQLQSITPVNVEPDPEVILDATIK